MSNKERDVVDIFKDMLGGLWTALFLVWHVVALPFIAGVMAFKYNSVSLILCGLIPLLPFVYFKDNESVLGWLENPFESGHDKVGIACFTVTFVSAVITLTVYVFFLVKGLSF